MLQITPQMKILVAVEPADFRKGIDGLARLCQECSGTIRSAAWRSCFAIAKRPRSKCWSTTVKVFGFATSVCRVAASAGGQLRRRRRPKPWRPTNSTFCFRRAIPKARTPWPIGGRSGHEVEARGRIDLALGERSFLIFPARRVRARSGRLRVLVSR